MSRHDVLIIKETHRGLLYEDGVFRHLLPAGRYQIPRPPSALAAFFGAKQPKVEVHLIDVRGRDRTVVVQDLLTADGATISASFVVLYRVVDPRAAIHEVKNYEDRLYGEVQIAARRALRGMSLGEIMAGRDEIGEELLRMVRETAKAYGVDLSGLDFKDLVIPDDLRRSLNRAASDRRSRRSQLVEARFLDGPDEGDDKSLIISSDEFGDADRDDPELIVAKMPIRHDPDSDPDADSHRDGLTFRPHPQEHRVSALRPTGSSGD